MKRILLVEDDEGLRTVLECVLQLAGYHVVSTRTAAAGRAHAHRLRYDLVVTDWRLGGATGATVVDAAMATGAKVIIVTGHLQDIPQADRARCVVLTKPFRSSALVTAVEQQIGSVRG